MSRINLTPDNLSCCPGCGMMPTRGAHDHTWECQPCRFAVWSDSADGAVRSWNEYSRLVLGFWNADRTPRAAL